MKVRGVQRGGTMEERRVERGGAEGWTRDVPRSKRGGRGGKGLGSREIRRSYGDRSVGGGEGRGGSMRAEYRMERLSLLLLLLL